MGRRCVKWLVLLVAVALLSAAMPVIAADDVTVKSTGKTVSLELKDIDVRSAVEALFRNSGKNFAVDPNVTGTVPALSLKDVEFDTALKSLTKSLGLVYRIDDDIYLISKRPETNSAPESYTHPVADAPEVQDTVASEIIIDKVPLNYTSASELLAVMSGTGREYGGGYGYGGYPGYGGYGGMGGYGTGGYGTGGFGGVNMLGGYGNGYGGYGSGYGSYGSGYGGYGGYGSNYGGYGGNYGGYGSGYGGYRGYGY